MRDTVLKISYLDSTTNEPAAIVTWPGDAFWSTMVSDSKLADIIYGIGTYTIQFYKTGYIEIASGASLDLNTITNIGLQCLLYDLSDFLNRVLEEVLELV